MINKLSRVTTYIETYAFDRRNGEMIKRSHATGFFVKTEDQILLVTNWHVVTGLNPAEKSKMTGNCVPEILKVTVISKENTLTELSFPLYDKELKPLWDEHPERNAVDLVVLPIPNEVEKHFYVFDILSKLDSSQIKQTVGTDAFILGYPFSKEHLSDAFGDSSHYYLPVWKRGSIATEPNLKIADRLILIDSMSRPGMSGSPVVISEYQDVMTAKTDKGNDIIKRINAGDTSALLEFDENDITNEKAKIFNILGIYSGVVGSTKLQELALGKCWHIDTLVDLIENHVSGEMPYHGPLAPHEYYEKFLDDVSEVMIRVNSNGYETTRVPMS
jgi:hypothetical protein